MSLSSLPKYECIEANLYQSTISTSVKFDFNYFLLYVPWLHLPMINLKLPILPKTIVSLIAFIIFCFYKFHMTQLYLSSFVSQILSSFFNLTRSYPSVTPGSLQTMIFLQYTLFLFRYLPSRADMIGLEVVRQFSHIKSDSHLCNKLLHATIYKRLSFFHLKSTFSMIQ